MRYGKLCVTVALSCGPCLYQATIQTGVLGQGAEHQAHVLNIHENLLKCLSLGLNIYHNPKSLLHQLSKMNKTARYVCLGRSVSVSR